MIKYDKNDQKSIKIDKNACFHHNHIKHINLW